MQAVEQNDGSKQRDKNTFSTQSSKQEMQIETDENFKIQRQKYLEQRLNRRKQIKQVRKQQFGSSSSESDSSQEKHKPKPKIVKDHQLPKPQIKQIPKSNNQEEQFHAKHQAYIREKLARKKQIIELKRKEFGSSSSDSDSSIEKHPVPIKIKNPHEIKEIKPTIQQHSPTQQKLAPQGNLSSPVKRSIGSQSNDNPKGPIVIRQVVEGKEKVSEARKLTVLVQSKKNQQWIEETMVIEKRKIKFINQNLEMMIGYVSKVKLFFTKIAKDHLKIKISYKDDDYFLGVSSVRKIDNLDEYYYVFSRIVEEKLIQIGFEPKKNEATIFPNYMNLKNAPSHLKNNAIVFGNILKKSQVLGNWETRFVYITDKQIGSSKRSHDKPSMIIPAESISEIWTRFDIENNNLLNIKIMYNSSTKTEFAIPISCFTDSLNWLYSFYRIINKKD